MISKLLIPIAMLLSSTAHAVRPATSKPAASAPAADQSALNQKAIHEAYNEGDFDKVVTLIEGFNKTNKSCSRADSIFIAKHLAVVYSANPQSREKGRYYMYRLLEMMPSAELVDMFVSDEIDRIFDKVRKEFLTRQKGFGVDSSQISMPNQPSHGSDATRTAAANGSSDQANAGSAGKQGSQAPQGSKEPMWKQSTFWIAGGAVLAIAGGAAIYFANQSPPQGKTYVIGN